MNKIILSLENINLNLKVSSHKDSSLKELFSNLFNSKIKKEVKDLHVLKDINLELSEGERLGIIGENGSGKSSLLKIISKVYEPSSGSIKCKLKVTPLLEAGTSFHPEYTGRENIFLNGAINGLSRKKIKNCLNEIIDFSGIKEFIDIPVKNYSTGMYTRLAFSAATAFSPELLIIDEIFVGGDYKFIEKAEIRLQNLVNNSNAMIVVSHNLELIKKICNRFIWIEKGLIKGNGDVSVLDQYLNS